MCGSCGCSDGRQISYHRPEADARITGIRQPIGAAGPVAAEVPRPSAPAAPAAHGPHAVELEAQILAKNDALAASNRRWFKERGILALNLLSAPGAGKTRLLERTLIDLRGQMPFSVVEGDQATLNDARRIRATGTASLQINTGSGCHLEADMLARALDELQPEPASVLIIENVGNLVCPALFDLGEQARVVILSVTEGEDKPQKYPHMFQSCDLMLLSKIDLLPHLDFDLARCLESVREINPRIEVLPVSAVSGRGLQAWYRWLQQQRPVQQAQRHDPAA